MNSTHLRRTAIVKLWRQCRPKATSPLEPKNPQRTETNRNGRYISTDELIKSYENRILDLEQPLARVTDRETALMDEKSKLLDLLTAENEEKRALMPPVEKSPNWILRLLFGMR